MKRVLLAVITEGDHCVAPFCSSLVQSVKAGFANDIELFPVFFSADGNWSMAFNQAATLAWREKLDGFLCIDPRVRWDAESLLALVNSDNDAVALPVATRGGFQIRLGEIARLQDNGEEIKVQGTSLDFLYLSPYAIDCLCNTTHLISYRGSEVKLILQSGDIYAAYFDPSEILAHHLRESGIEVMVSYKHTAYRQDLIEYSNSFNDILTQLKANG
jgi:hypothetical protein